MSEKMVFWSRTATLSAVAVFLSVFPAGGAFGEIFSCDSVTKDRALADVSLGYSDVTDPVLPLEVACASAEKSDLSQQEPDTIVDSANVRTGSAQALRKLELAITALRELKELGPAELTTNNSQTATTATPANPVRSLMSSDVSDVPYNVYTIDTESLDAASQSLQQVTQIANDAVEAAMRSTESAVSSAQSTIGSSTPGSN